MSNEIMTNQILVTETKFQFGLFGYRFSVTKFKEELCGQDAIDHIQNMLEAMKLKQELKD